MCYLPSFSFTQYTVLMNSMLSFSKPKKTWRRMIAVVELFAFPTEIEQMDNPSLQGRPICLVNGEQGSIVIAASSEAQARGIQIGMTWLLAKEHCPESVRVVARPARYGEISRQIMAALRAFSPEVEVVAANEAFLDLTSCQSYYRHEPDLIGRLIQETVYAASSGLPCSIGISGDKTSARWAAKQQQGGLTVLHPERGRGALA
jgi:DNA polymerase-4